MIVNFTKSVTREKSLVKLASLEFSIVFRLYACIFFNDSSKKIVTKKFLMISDSGKNLEISQIKVVVLVLLWFRMKFINQKVFVYKRTKVLGYKARYLRTGNKKCLQYRISLRDCSCFTLLSNGRECVKKELFSAEKFL